MDQRLKSKTKINLPEENTQENFSVCEAGKDFQDTENSNCERQNLYIGFP